ncbi:MAG: hypothetical protein ACRDSR_25565 [Pseudonocardiaceae bacterium]
MRDALAHHADVMSGSTVRYAAVAEADDRVLDALNIYRESAERITGLSVLLCVPLAGVAPEDGREIPDRDGDDAGPVTQDVVLEARWQLTVTEPRLLVAAASGGGSATGSEVTNGDLQSALAALFERDVPWPPSEYSKIGLTVTGMNVVVHPAQAGGE